MLEELLFLYMTSVVKQPEAQNETLSLLHEPDTEAHMQEINKDRSSFFSRSN